MKATLPSDPPSVIASLKFTCRRESWVAESSGYFYKIIRKSNDPLRDLQDPDCIETALRERTDMRFLHGLSDRVCRTDRIEQACIVYPLLSGPDMRMLLMNKAAHEQHATCLRDAMMLLARLHCAGVEPTQYPIKDYRRDSFLAPDQEILERMDGRRRTLVVTGFEARNFRFDKNRSTWVFFDPHHLWLGFPEEDFARFMVSLLMIKGRRRGLLPWTGFDRFGLLSTYDSLAPATLDRRLLNYFLYEQLAKRRFYAMRTTERISAPGRVFVRAYTKLYYRRLWRALATQRFCSSDKVPNSSIRELEGLDSNSNPESHDRIRGRGQTTSAPNDESR